jgi:NTE family protein
LRKRAWEIQLAFNGATLGLALSGGGYRATLFGLGSLWRLNDAGLLGKLDRITSVSGGAILAGVLAQHWKQLKFEDGRAVNFSSMIVGPVRKFCGETIDVGVFLGGALNPFKSTGDMLVSTYKHKLFGDMLLRDIPSAGNNDNPKFIFYATNMQTGRSFRFRQDIIADYRLGTMQTTDTPLAVAVAASSAFPPIFSPVVIATEPSAWKEGADLPDINELRSRIVLTDGGVYDNMGLESLVGNADIVLVSDAGAPFTVEKNPSTSKPLQLGRIRDILIDQTRALRKRWLISEFEAGRARGAYWGIGTRIAGYDDADSMTKDSAISEALEHLPTRLKGHTAEQQGHLINWGYALCDAALRSRANLPIGKASSWPVSEWGL